MLMLVWAEDEEIVCIHPGGPRLSGYAAIREAWRRIFVGGVRFRIRLSDHTVVQTPFAAVHTVIEHISVRNDEAQRAPVVATNVFVRSALGWRMILHHASPAPPDSVAETPKILH
jgi:ketosteroid isomerase-like protein